MEHTVFQETVQSHWLSSPIMGLATRTISAKFKGLRVALKIWSKNLSNLSELIANCNKVIAFLDSLEDVRQLFNPEYNLGNLVKKQLATLLIYKNEYWKSVTQ